MMLRLPPPAASRIHKIHIAKPVKKKMLPNIPSPLGPPAPAMAAYRSPPARIPTPEARFSSGLRARAGALRKGSEISGGRLRVMGPGKGAIVRGGGAVVNLGRSSYTLGASNDTQGRPLL